MRLDKFLADMGMDTRSDIKKNIRKGMVTVNGELVRDAGFVLDETASPRVTYLGREVNYHTSEYYMMNKPAGVLSATEDKKQQTILDLMSGQKRKDLFPVGRLDKDTEGLLLITNDGQMAHKLLAPKHHVDKVYYLKASGPLKEEDVQAFRKGIRFDEHLLAMPADLKILSSSKEESEAYVTIREGKYHQIKKMIAALGAGSKDRPDMEVTYLKRLKIGSLELDDGLAPGDYRLLTQEELDALRALTS